MAPADKGSAVAAIAADLGHGGAHTPAVPEIGDLGDLFRAIDEDASAYDASTVAPVRRGRGRPAGSVSRATKDMRAWLQSRGYRDPLEFLGAILSADTIELAAALGAADRVEVLKLQIRAAESAAQYLHQRAPMAVEIKGDGPRPLVMIVDGVAMRVAGGGDGTMSVHDPVIIQGVSHAMADQSHDGRSHDDD